MTCSNVGVAAERDATIIGDAVNTVFRLEAVSKELGATAPPVRRFSGRTLANSAPSSPSARNRSKAKRKARWKSSAATPRTRPCSRTCKPSLRGYFAPSQKTGAYWFRLIVRYAGGMSWKSGWPRKISGQNNKRERLRRPRSRGLIDRDVPTVTPDKCGSDDIRLVRRRCDRATG